MYNHLQELLGEEDTGTLMGYLPPVGWADMATKRDLDQLGQVIRAEMGSLEARLEARIGTGLASLEARIDTGLASLESRFEASLARASLDTRSSLRTLFLGLVGLQMSGAALAVAVARAA
ncbi:MAG: hypothetical protein ACR2MO_06710 [Acidimicrobiales bacterium]